MSFGKFPKLIQILILTMSVQDRWPPNYVIFESAMHNVHGRFKDDTTRWPPILYRHIFCYFVERPEIFTKQELMQ